MSKLNPIEESNFIEKEFRNYLKSTFNFNDSIYQKMFEEELNNAVLYKGPFIKATLPFKSVKSLKELINENIASAEFEKLNNINLERKLYLHQEQAFKKIMNGENVVITTGTGSGKTESFLYPILNSILKEIENGENTKGVRAILLYPMNALVNDQIERVREILSDYPEIKYGFFTGDTEPNKNIEEYRKELEELNDCKIPKNELITRKQIREEIPHLLFTNYSMLEYLLIRPNDYVLFTADMLEKWRYVVLDEAHTYKGALGIEVAMLLRRLTGMANKKPQFILTSATLGEKGKSETDIVNFAQSLTNCNFNTGSIIFSTREELNKKNIKYTVSPDDYIEIEKNIENLSKVKEAIKKYENIQEDNINQLLYNFLEKDSNIYNLQDVLVKRTNFQDVMENMKYYNFTNELQLISLIHLINLARKDGYKILYDMKYHTFIRTLSGAFVTLGKNRTLKLSKASFINEKKAFELGNCKFCNASYLIGKITPDGYLIQNNDIDIYENYDESLNANLDYFIIKENINVEDIDMDLCEEYEICSKCGKITNISEIDTKKCECEQSYKVKLLKVETTEIKNNLSECPCCKRRANSGIVRNLSLGKDEATALLGQILYQAIDINEEEAIINNDKDWFCFELELDKPKGDKDKVKQYIAFSDSRQQASFFADFFEYNFKRFLRNRLLWECLENSEHQPIQMKHLIMNIKNIIENKSLFKDSDLDSEKEAWLTVLK